MSDKVMLIIFFAVFSVFEIFIMLRYLKMKKKIMNFVENILIYSLTSVLLYYEYVQELNVINYITASLIITILGHTFIGEYFDVYHKSKIYDRFLHLFGAFSFSLFSYSILDDIVNPDNSSKLYISLFVAALGISIGTLFELVEFAHDTFSKTTPISQHGLADTDFDMIFNVIGSVIAGVVSVRIFI